MVISAWSRAQLETRHTDLVDQLAVVDDDDLVAVGDGSIDIWDSWPIRTRDGSIAEVCGHVVWVALAAPSVGDPGLRHDIAEHRAFMYRDARTGGHGSFDDLGPLFDDGAALGSRQWAGSTLLDGDRLTAFYTAAGPGFRQRLAAATATVDCGGAEPRFVDWSDHVQILEPDLDRYDAADQTSGEPGFIKAFRDPFPFVDPASGEQYLFFTASLAPGASTTEFNGAVGVARRVGDALDDWEMLDPVVTADGVNNELERPHVVVRDGRYYLFISTQSRTFHPELTAPTGLYGFVADAVLGPYRPLNGHGTVFVNPPSRPRQTYSWLVLNDLSVVGFVDAYGYDGVAEEIVLTPARDARRSEFGGTFAPTVRIEVDGDRARLARA